jgi:hypothetical protein
LYLGDANPGTESPQYKIEVNFRAPARNIAVTLFEKDTICLIRWTILRRAA